MQRLREEAAKRLLYAAVQFENQHSSRLQKANPKKRGTATVYTDSSGENEYPRRRTGFGQSRLTHQPKTVREITATQEVRVGYYTDAEYMLILELFKKRLGLKQTLADMREQLAATVNTVNMDAA